MADFDNTATSFGDSSQAASGMLENFSVPGETANGTSVDVHSSLEATLKHLEKLSESLVRQQKQKEDEFDCFGKSIAVQLKKLPLTSAMKLKVKIQTLLTEERITCLDANRKNTSEPSDNNSVVMEEEEEDIERLIECTAIIKEKEERPPSRSSELSLHVSCSSSDDDDSEREDG